MKNEFVIITGATSGLGRAFSLACAQNNWPIILLDQIGTKTKLLSESLEKNYNIPVHAFEVNLVDIEEVKTTIQYIAEQFEVFFLINNIGIGGTSKIQETSIERIGLILDINIKCTSIITSLIITAMLRNKQQQYILNVASMAAFTPIAYKNVYPASKAFISSYSIGLKEELKHLNIHVAALYPGLMTNSDVSNRIFKLGFKGTIGLLSTDTIAKYAINKTLAKKTIIVPGIGNKINQILLQLIPANLKINILSKQVLQEIKTPPSIINAH
jgi:short-subunit dehydrogenase